MRKIILLPILAVLIGQPLVINAEDKAAAPAKAPVIEAPLLKNAYVPVYPIELFREGKEGKVLVEIALDNKGKVESAKVIDSPDERFNESAVYAAERFEFEPAKKDGKAASIRLRVNVAFSLDKAVLDAKDVDQSVVSLNEFDMKLPRPDVMWFHDGEKLMINLDFVVDKTGNVSFIHINEYTNETYARAFVEAVKNLKYEPALVDGKPVSVMIRLERIKNTGKIIWY